MKQLMLIICLGLFVPIARAQTQDVVYLKNGSIIRGQLKEASDKVVIETVNNNLLVFAQAEVEKISNEPTMRKKVVFRTRGYYSTTGLGLYVGRNKWAGVFDPNLKMVNGFQLSEHWAVGLGTALESYEYNGGIFSFSADSRYYLANQRTSPYINVFGGYSIPLSNYWIDQDRTERARKGGANGGGSLGIRHFVANGTAIDLSVGYAGQVLTEKQIDNWWWSEHGPEEYKRIFYYNRLYFRFGFYFN